MIFKKLDWRGPDSSGISLSAWLWFIVLSFTVCYLGSVYESLIMVFPFAIFASVSIPVLQKIIPYFENKSNQNAVYRSLETLVLMLILALLGWFIFGFVISKNIPIDTADHQIMIARAEAFMEGLRKGKILHWTHAYQGGDSLTDLYPGFANYLSALFYFIAPRGTPFVIAYTWMVLFAWWLRGVAVYTLARHFSGIPVSLILAIASLLEVGADVWDGVWSAAIYWGVIHSNIALSIGALATTFQIKLLKNVSTKNILLCIFWFAITAYAHPLGILYCGISGVSVLFLLVFLEQKENSFWTFIAIVLGTMIAAVWILPYTHALKTIGFNWSVVGMDYGSLGKGLLNASVPISSFGAFIGLALIAVTATVTSGDKTLVCTGLCALIFYLLSCSSFLVQSHFLEYFTSFLDGQPRRMLTVLKTVTVPSLAWILSLCYSRLSRVGSLKISAVLGRALILVLLFLGPIHSLSGALIDLSQLLRTQIVSPTFGGQREIPHTGADYHLVFDWIKQRRDEDPSPVLWRTAIFWNTRWRHTAWTEGFKTGVPVVDFTLVCANFLANRPREMSLEGFNDWNIKYVITDHDYPPFQPAELKFESGGLKVWEMPLSNPSDVVAPTGVSISPILRDGDSMIFQVSNAPADGVDILLHTAWLPRWRAKENGISLKVWSQPPRANAQPKQDQIGVHVYNGNVVLSCDGPMPLFWTGLVINLVGISASLLFISKRYRNLFQSTVKTIVYKFSNYFRGKTIFFIIFILTIFAWFHGSRKMIYSTIEDFGMNVSMLNSWGKMEKCSSEWWRGRYTCQNGEAVIDAWPGTSLSTVLPMESHQQWPGVRVQSRGFGTPLQIQFQRIRFDKPSLLIKSSTSGSFQISGFVGDVNIPARIYQGEMTDVISLPNISGIQDVTLSFKPMTANASIVFRGDS